MDDKNNFALVPRPPSAIEKSQPGAKRVLSDMVRETLALDRRESDATPLTLSIAGDDGSAIPVFKRNTIIPARTTKILSGNRGTTTALKIILVQGEKPIAAENVFVGEYMIENVVPAADGKPQVEAIFDIDINGILHVSAKDIHTGKQQTVRIKNQGAGLSKNEIERLLNSAEVAKSKV